MARMWLRFLTLTSNPKYENMAEEVSTFSPAWDHIQVMGFCILNNTVTSELLQHSCLHWSSMELFPCPTRASCSNANLTHQFQCKQLVDIYSPSSPCNVICADFFAKIPHLTHWRAPSQHQPPSSLATQQTCW